MRGFWVVALTGWLGFAVAAWAGAPGEAPTGSTAATPGSEFHSPAGEPDAPGANVKMLDETSPKGSGDVPPGSPSQGPAEDDEEEEEDFGC